jgi:hypothetical protein
MNVDFIGYPGLTSVMKDKYNWTLNALMQHPYMVRRFPSEEELLTAKERLAFFRGDFVYVEMKRDPNYILYLVRNSGNILTVEIAADVALGD